MDKKALRREIRYRKSQYSREQLSDLSAGICERVVASHPWQSASTVLLYYPLPDEVDTRLLIEKSVALGKRVLLPVVVGDDLELREYKGVSSMKEGAFGILEPTGDVFPEDRYCEIDFAVVPGMAFDEENNRLGRGRGYYDRLLPRLRRAMLAGVCFPFQIVKKIHTESHDISMDVVVSAE